MLLVICILLYSCREKYLPEIKDINPNYLVVDGFINTGADSTIFNLSRTFKLESKAVTAPEKAAIVTVESDAGTSYVLPESALKPGVYAVPALNLDQTKKYRVRIRTKDNREYLSDFVENKVSPPLDLTFDFRHDNLNIYSKTYDATGKSRYYNYTYVETWQYRAPLHSIYKIGGGKIVDRVYPQDEIFDCYHQRPSSKITIANTTTLTEDRLADNLLLNVSSTDERVKIAYSILVKQHVLTKAGFEFYETMNKNTEKVGSIFDAQPSLLRGNIICTTNMNEVVIGFVNAGTTTEKRIFLTAANDFPFNFTGPLPDEYCNKRIDTLNLSQVRILLLNPPKSDYTPIDWVNYLEPDKLLATTALECVDCRKQGGTLTMPSYWKR